MAKGAKKGPAHPASKFLQAALVLVIISCIFAFVSLFVPWSLKKPSSTERKSIQLFQNCYWDPTHYLDLYSCQENNMDLTYPNDLPIYGDAKCRGYFMATTAFTFLTFIFALFCICALVFVLSKIHTKPVAVCAAAAVLVFLTWVFCMLAWIMYIVYAEHPCGTRGIPMRGYSVAFILMILASVMMLFAMCLAYFALIKLKKWQPPQPEFTYPEVDRPMYFGEPSASPYNVPAPYSQNHNAPGPDYPYAKTPYA